MELTNLNNKSKTEMNSGSCGQISSSCNCPISCNDTYFCVLFVRLFFHQAAKLLDNGRSQTIGIIMSSLSCQLDDVKTAVYKMDNSVLDMDG